MNCVKYDVPKEIIAGEMTRRTPYIVEPDMVVTVRNDQKNAVYAAQVKHFTIICHATISGKFNVFYVPLVYEY